MWKKFLFMALAGVLGTFARYGLAGAVQRWAGSGFPWGTLAVNILGCFLAGTFWAAAENRIHITGEIRVIVLVGFMGAFTTFSSFMLETSTLLRDAEYGRAIANLLLQNGIGLSMLFLGLMTGKMI